MDELWTMLRAVAEKGDEAWQPLLAKLEPELAQMARRQPIGRLRDNEDTPREIVTRTIARLHAKQYAAIKKLVATEPKPELQAWLRVLVKRSPNTSARPRSASIVGSRSRHYRRRKARVRCRTRSPRSATW
jgi:hypothetical protein